MTLDKVGYLLAAMIIMVYWHFFLSEQDLEFLKLHHSSLAEVANHLTAHLVVVLSQQSLGKGIIRYSRLMEIVTNKLK